MGYASLRACVEDLERHGRLLRVTEEVDPHLEMAEVQRRVYQAGGPAIYFERVKGCAFPAVSNLFGTIERSRFMFRDALRRTQAVIAAKADPTAAMKAPWRAPGLGLTALRALPREVDSGPVLDCEGRLSELPQIVSWPDDGGPFVTLPQVLSQDPERPGIMHTNVGMYRIQLAGNHYAPEREVGLHYQIHRGIGVHHTAAIEKGERLPVSVFVGGPPAHTLGAVMPLPEGLSELTFSGMLGRRRVRWARRGPHIISTDADFCIVGHVRRELLPEGPFGDHLGYYSLEHPFPVLEVEHVFHRRDAIWPFTVVGRPPQEDTTFGQLIHELTGPMVPVSIPGVREMHAVDAAGVHPLLLAIGSERYVPYGERRPQELLTVANAILGFGQASLAKYLWIAAGEDDRDLSASRPREFMAHVLRRIDLRRDLHFQTRTTIDTLDYSGDGLNEGSKLVIAAAGEVRRTLGVELPANINLPPGFANPRLVMPGIVAVEGPPVTAAADGTQTAEQLSRGLGRRFEGQATEFPLVVLCDDADFVARSEANFLWATFTRSNPARDVYGVGGSTEHKHWGCEGSLVIDARHKPHHAPPLIEDPAVTRRVDALGAAGGSLHGVI